MIKCVKLLLALNCYYSLAAQPPRLVLPVGHTSSITQAQFSPNGKHILTTSFDRTTKIWSAQTGQLLVDLEGHTQAVKFGSFSEDGRLVLTGGDDSCAKIWEVYSGKAIASFRHAEPVSFVTLLKNSEYLAVQAGYKLYIWNTLTQKLTNTFPVYMQLTRQSFSQDGNTVLLADGDLPHLLIQNIFIPDSIIRLKGHRDFLNEAKFSPAENYILSKCDRGEIKIWDATSHGVIQKIGNDLMYFINTEFSSKQNFLLTVNIDSLLQIWEFKENKWVLGKIEMPNAREAVFFPDESKILVVLGDTSIQVIDIATGKILQNFLNHSNSYWVPSSRLPVSFLRSTMISAKSSEVLIFRHGAAYLSRLSLNDNAVQEFINHSYPINSMDILNNSNQLLTALNDKSIRSWDMRALKQISTMFSPQSIYHLSTLNNNQFEARSSDSIRTWNANTGLIVDSKKDPIIFYPPDSKKDSIWSSDNRIYIPYDLENNIVSVFDVSTHQLLYTLKHETSVEFIDFSYDGKFIVTTDMNNFFIWNGKNGNLLKKIKARIPMSFTLSKGLTKLAFVDSGNVVRIYDLGSGNLIRMTAHKLPVHELTFSPDEEILSVLGYKYGEFNNPTTAVWSLNGKFPDVEYTGHTRLDFENGKAYTNRTKFLSIFNLGSPHKIVDLIQIDNSDFIFITPDSYYYSSKNAAKLLHYVNKDLETISFEQLDVKYNRPDKVFEAIGSTDSALIRSYRKAYEKRIKKLGIDTTAFRDGYSIPEADFTNRDKVEYEQKDGKVKLVIKSADSTYKLDRFNVWVNETPLYGQRGVSLRNKNKNNFDSTISIDLSEGENKIETSITNANGTESYRMPLLVNYAPVDSQKINTYFIGIGIDEFKESKYNLKYSTKDIRDLSKKLKEKYKDIIIDTMFNENVTVNNVKALKQKLLQTSVNDKVIISYSGHGMLSKDFDYYLSTYAVNFDKPEENGLPYDELESLLDSIPARKKLMLIDACHSGEVDKDDLIAMNDLDSSKIKRGLKPVAYKKEGQLGLKNSFELMQSLFVNVGKSTGATIISAAAGTQFALEGVNNLPNGVFTYCILEAMNKYPTMKISELKKTVGERVVEITKGLQKPTSRNETIAVDWNIW